MNFNILSLRAFICLAEELNFSKAAVVLHMSPSRLTRVIQNLESQVGTALFFRNTHNVTLNPLGIDFLQSARRMTAEADWVGHRLARNRSTDSATFNVGCVSGALYDALPNRVRALRNVHTGLQLRLVEMNESALMNRVLDGTVDIGFLYFPTLDDEIISRMVSSSPQCVAMEPEHRLATRESISIWDLDGEMLILPDEDQSPRLHQWYRSFLDKPGKRGFKYVEANQISVALGLSIAGEGMCVCPYFMRSARPNELRFLPLTHAPKIELFAVWRRDSPVRQIAQLLARWGSPLDEN